MFFLIFLIYFFLSSLFSSSNMNKQILNFPTVYLFHGGGPFPLTQEPSQLSIRKFLKEIPKTLPIPKTILLISAHWEASPVRILSKKEPNLYYDYYGFPKELYNFKYPIKNDLNLVDKITSIFEKNSIAYKLDDTRDYDHGVFVPLLLMYPEANIPVVQISLVKGLDVETHLKIGEALAPLRNEEVLIIGSGSSFHGFFLDVKKKELTKHSENFDSYLEDVCLNKNYTPNERKKKLIEWKKAPSAKYAHPREEHLLPLMVNVGAAGGSVGERIYEDYYDEFKMGAYLFK